MVKSLPVPMVIGGVIIVVLLALFVIKTFAFGGGENAAYDKNAIKEMQMKQGGHTAPSVIPPKRP